MLSPNNALLINTLHVKYKQANGDCLVHRDQVVDGVKLGQWLNHNRHEYRKHQEGKPSLLAQDRIEKLEGLGFDWNAPDSDGS